MKYCLDILLILLIGIVGIVIGFGAGTININKNASKEMLKSVNYIVVSQGPDGTVNEFTHDGETYLIYSRGGIIRKEKTK